MTKNGNLLENASAERINGILKEEYQKRYQINNIKQAKEQLAKAVKLYNKQRHYFSIGLFTPEIVHSKKNQNRENMKKLL